MKATIKVLVKEDICSPQIFENGDWIDLKSAEDVYLPMPQGRREHKVNNEKRRDIELYAGKVSLGVCIKVPAGYEATLLPRSSSFIKYGFIQANSEGVIDNSFSGNDDVWKLPIIAVGDVNIKKGDRIAQFRIQLSQKATLWQRIKWLFTSGVKIEYVTSLSDNNRGGFGEGTKDKV